MTELLEDLIALDFCPKCGYQAHLGLVRNGFGQFMKTCYCKCGIFDIVYDMASNSMFYSKAS